MFKIIDNYLYKDNKPFFWLGDTAWQLFDKLNDKEIKMYLENRHTNGFNVVQAVCLLNLSEEENKDLSLAYDLTNEYRYKHWNKIKNAVKLANSLDMYFALFPNWGQLFRNNFLNEANYEGYVCFLADFFKDCNNIIWALGGDIRGDFNIDLFNKMGSLLKEKCPDKLVTFHPFGRTGSYLWFNDEKWLDFNMYQSGHRRYDQLDPKVWDNESLDEAHFGPDAYKYVKKAMSYKNTKPILDGEPSYEDVVQGLHKLDEPHWQADDVRRYAYWGVFAGACGFTYGHNSLIQIYPGYGPGLYGVSKKWSEVLNTKGAVSLKHLKKLMLEYDFTCGKSNDDIVINQGIKYEHISVFCGNDYILIYDYLGKDTVLDLTSYNGKRMKVELMNPETGEISDFDKLIVYGNYQITNLKKREASTDWVIIIKEE